MSVLHLKVLGGFEARLPSGDFAEIPIRKGRALLAYLALNPGQVFARAKLADLLWGDRGDTQATIYSRGPKRLELTFDPVQAGEAAGVRR